MGSDSGYFRIGLSILFLCFMSDTVIEVENLSKNYYWSSEAGALQVVAGCDCGWGEVFLAIAVWWWLGFLRRRRSFRL